MNNKLLCGILLGVALPMVPATAAVRTKKVKPTYNDSIMSQYIHKLDTLVALHNVQEVSADSSSALVFNPYFFPLIAGNTMFDAPVRQAMHNSWQATDGPSASSFFADGAPLANRLSWGDVNKEMNRTLAMSYINNPASMLRTEADVDLNNNLRNESAVKVKPAVKLEEKVNKPQVVDELGTVEIQTHRPNFWKFKGDCSLRFTQSNLSDNWYKGGESNNMILVTANLEANYNNKQKFKWDNRLETRLGFVTSKSDKVHKYKSNSDLLRFTSSVGLQAAKHWDYSLMCQASTQFYPGFRSNDERAYSDFTSPLNVTVAPSMKYNYNKNKVSMDVNIAPLAYDFRYVARESLRSSFGIDEGKSCYHHFGPNVNGNFNWQISKNVKWRSHLYWFSNYESTVSDWENTFEFSFSKYLSSSIFLHARFDDSSRNRYDEDLGYFMYYEYITFGLSYNF